MGKILVLTNHSYMLYRFRLDLLKALAQAHEVVLSMPFTGHEDDFLAEGFRCIETAIERRKYRPGKDWRLFFRYRQLLWQEKPDLVITYSIKPNIYGGLACRLTKLPYCANIQGLGTAFQKPWLRLMVTPLYRFALQNASTVFFENAESARVFVQRKIAPKDKTQVLPGAGIDLERYAYHPYPQNACFRFLYVGRIMQEKGISELLCAAQRLYKEGHAFTLDIAGFFEDGYQKSVQKLQAQGIVKFYGFQENTIPFYHQADCVVLPSYHEGMSNVLLEAAAIGRPIIASNIPGCREAVDNGVSGLLCSARDAESLYKAMKTMLLLPWEKRCAMGKAGHIKMKQEFNKKQVVKSTIQALPLQPDM